MKRTSEVFVRCVTFTRHKRSSVLVSTLPSKWGWGSTGIQRPGEYLRPASGTAISEVQ